MEHVDIDLERASRDIERPRRGPMDMPYMLLVVLLCSIGLVMMFSASYASGAADEELGPAFYVSRQGIFALLGLGLMLLISRLNYHYFKMLSLPAMGMAVALLILVLFVGSAEKGARRWIHFGLFNVQASEVAKVALIMLFATMIAAYPEWLSQKKFLPTLRGLLPYLAIIGVVVGLIVIEPHYSGAIIILAVGAGMLFMGGLAYKWIFMVGGLAVTGISYLIMAAGYARERIDIWQNPWLDPSESGYQTIQSLYAIGSGGLFGVGLGQSRQKHLYLPEPQNDFVFAIVCEELGLIGAGIVLFLFMLLIVRGYWIALHTGDRFGMLLVSGVTTLLAVQTFLNVAVVTNLIPVTGISMPFFSYGGSSLLILMTQMGIVLAVSREIKPGIK